MPVCFVCTHDFSSIRSLFLHFKIKHKLHDGSICRCREPNCFRDFVSFKTFRKHLKTKHNVLDLNKRTAPLVNTCKNKPMGERKILIVDSDDSAEETQSDSTLTDVISSFVAMLKQQTMSFIARLYASSVLPRNAVQQIIDHMKEFLQSGFLKILENYVMNILKAKDFENKCSQENIELMFNKLINPFENLDSEYQRFQEFENCNFFIRPTEYVVGQRQKPKKTQNNLSLDIVDSAAHFIPLRHVFAQFFKLPNILTDISNYTEDLKKDTETISNIYQSEHFKDILRKHPNNDDADTLILPIAMYYDDYETGNPLGSHSGVHKLGAAYVSILCLPPQYQSLIENIFLCLLFHSNDRKDFGNKAIFDTLIKEFQFLECSGITVYCSESGKNVKLYFVLTLILGDNLGLHSVLGFTESFNANFSCRFCKANRLLCHTQIQEDVTLRRKLEDYDTDLQINDMSRTGIKEKCIFNSLGYMHAYQNYYVDIMHDLFEGVCHYDMVHMLKYFIIEANLFSVDVLNNRLEMFDFGFESSNKPTKIPNEFHLKNKLSMSASEMLCFYRFFNLLIGDLIPKNNDIWNFYILFRDILDLITTDNVTDAVINRLKDLIPKYTKNYVLLFRDTLKPKHHHLLHYTFVMSKIGPLKNISAFRFESKHRESKKSANVISSRRNITKSLTIKNQLKLCYRIFTNMGFSDVIIFGPSEHVSFSDLCETLEMNFALVIPTDFNASFSPKWISLGSIKYKQNFTIMVDFEDNLPKFGVIKKILLNDFKQIGFVYQEVKVVCFNRHMYAYEVETTTIKKFVTLKCEELFGFSLVLLTIQADGKLYASLRNYV